MLKELNLDYLPGEYGRGNAYVIDLGSDVELGKIYTLLDNAEEVYQEEESVLLTVHISQILYTYKEDYHFVLNADFDNDLYSLICSELK